MKSSSDAPKETLQTVKAGLQVRFIVGCNAARVCTVAAHATFMSILPRVP